MFADRGRNLFNQLQNVESIRVLIGQTEDVHLDCKEWPSVEQDAQRVLAKAACGLTNSEGGVIVVGVRARAIAKDEPDLIDSLTPVSDTSAVKSRILDLVGQLVEPRIERIETAEIRETEGLKSGFVVLYIPPSEGPPRRSKKDWKFYQRIGSGTFPMEYFQIQERFGKRPSPRLELVLEEDGIKPLAYTPRALGLKNAGAGMAKFPSIRFPRSEFNLGQFGIDGNGGFGLPPRPSESEWIVFRGGVDDVLYPNETRRIARLWQQGGNIDSEGRPYPRTIGPAGRSMTSWVFKAVTFHCEISCEGIPTIIADKTFAEYSLPIGVSDLVG
jgi:hypothetical protein